MRYRAAAVVLALAAAAAIGQVPMYSDYPWGLLDNGVDKGPVYNLNCKPPLWCSIPSYGDGVIQLGDGGVLPIWVAYANDAGWAERSLRANFSDDAGFADLSGTAFFALDAGFSFTSGTAGTAGYAFDAGAANFATSAGVAVYALDAGRANYADNAGNAATAATATYALDAGRANYADSAGTAGAAGVATYALDAGNVVCLGCIIADRIGIAAVIREKIQAGAINHTVIEDGGILGNNITPGGVTSTQIAAGGVATANIATGAVTANEIGALAVTEAKINTGAVTNTKLGDLSVSTGKLQDLAVSTGKLNDLAVTEGKLGALSVTEGKIGALAVTNGKIGALAVDSAKLAAAAVTTAKIATGAVTSNELGALAVTTAKIAAGAVTSTELGSAAVTTAKLATGAVTTNELGAGAVTNAKLASLAVATGNIQAGAVTTNELGASAVTNAKLASLAVATGNIQSGAVTSNELGALAVTTAKIANANVTTAKVADLGITASKLDDGISLSAYDEETVAGIASRTTATNATKGAWDGITGYIRLTLAVGSTNPQLSTGLTTGTSTNLITTNAVMRYRISGGASGNVLKLEAINTANVAQKSSTVFLADGNWHTAVFDISGWATAGTLRVDLTTNALGSTGYWDVAYIATGVAGSGTGALISYQGKVGVGTPTPGQKLSVRGGIMENSSDGTTDSRIAFVQTDGANYPVSWLGIPSWNKTTLYLTGPTATGDEFAAWYGNATWQFLTGGTDRMRINSSGNVGIGTTSPGGGYRVHTYGVNPGIGIQNSGTGGGWLDFLNSAGSVRGNVYYDNASEFMSFGTNGNVERLRLASNGNVGIGTTSPVNRLAVYDNSGTWEVVNAAQANATSYALYRATNSGGNTADFGIGAGTSTTSVIRVNGTERVAITSAGKVGVGVSSPEEQLEVRTAASAYGVLHSDGTRKVGSYVDTTGGWVGTKSNHDLKLFTNNGASRLTITATGETRVISLAGTGNRAVYSDANGALTNSSSDATLKTAIEDIRNPLRMVLNLRPVSFSWKDTARFGPQREVGFIAQEVMTVVPEVVGTNSDGTYTVDYAKLVSVLAGAIQELYADRTALAQRVQALEDKAEAAEKRLSDLEARLAKLEAK